MALVDFEVIKETWNVVEAEDGSVIRVRPVLLFLTSEDVEGVVDQSNDQQLRRTGMRLTLQIAVWGHEKGEPSDHPLSTEEVEENVTDKNIKFRFLRRGESAYRLEDGSELRIKAPPVEISKSSLYDEDGEPAFLIGTEGHILQGRPIEEE